MFTLAVYKYGLKVKRCNIQEVFSKYKMFTFTFPQITNKAVSTDRDQQQHMMDEHHCGWHQHFHFEYHS